MAFLRRLDDANRDASRDVKLAAVESANPEKGERSIVTSILQEWRNKKAAQQEALMADSKSRGPPPRGPSFRSDDAGSTEAADTTTTSSSAYAAGAEGDVDSWVRYVDEATGYPYYYNHATQESHWAAAEEAQAMDTDTATATAATFGASPSSYPSSSYSKYMTMSDVTATAGDDGGDDDDDDRDGREPSLLDKCSEYLFDVFESNLTPEYQRINAIQELAIASFAASDLEARPDHKQVYEYTFAQQEYHRQFCDLFEKLLEEFLTAEGLSVEAFVARLEATVADRSGGKESKRQRQVAHEVVDCIHWYASFDSWAESMREEARYRKRCEENHTPAVMAASAKASTSHRMDK